MPKTLADYNPDERERLRGMWAESKGGLFIYQLDITHLGRTSARLFNPQEISVAAFRKLEDVTPRFDLPPAWQPDGSPLPGKWEVTS